MTNTSKLIVLVATVIIGTIFGITSINIASALKVKRDTANLQGNCLVGTSLSKDLNLVKEWCAE